MNHNEHWCMIVGCAGCKAFNCSKRIKEYEEGR